MAISRKNKYNTERVRAAQLEGARSRLNDLINHRPDPGNPEWEANVAEARARIAELEAMG